MADRRENRSEDWRPNLFVPGFPKCGTTALCDYLRQHPDIYMIETKEPNTLAIGIEFPSWDTRHNRVVRPYSAHMDPGTYEKLFTSHRSSRYRGDGSQTYTFPPRFPSRLKEFSPDAKVILMIREQKQRLLSQYFFGFNMHLEPDFQRWIDRRFRAQASFFLFEKTLRSFHELFGDSMRVVDSRALTERPGDVLRELFRFLGLDPLAVAPLHSNVTAMKMNERQRMRALPLLRVRSRVMTPVTYVLNMVDPGGIERTKIPLGKLNPFGSFGRRATHTKSPKAGSQAPAVRVQERIPEDLKALLDRDYAASREFCRSANIMLA